MSSPQKLRSFVTVVVQAYVSVGHTKPAYSMPNAIHCLLPLLIELGLAVAPQAFISPKDSLKTISKVDGTLILIIFLLLWTVSKSGT